MIPHQNNKKTIDQDQRGCEKWKEKDQKQFYTDRLYLLVRHVSGRLLRLVLLPITHNGDCAIVKDTAPAPSYPSSPATLPRPGASWVPLTLSSTNAFAGVWSIPLLVLPILDFIQTRMCLGVLLVIVLLAVLRLHVMKSCVLN